MFLSTKPDFDQCMERIGAWYAGHMLDRPPIRFSRHNAAFSGDAAPAKGRWPDLRSRWFDAHYQIDSAIAATQGRRFLGETFPVFYPNLGPNILAAALGCELHFEETTSWETPILLGELGGNAVPVLDMQRSYVKKIEEMTYLALERSEHRFLVGYTDIHPGLDLLAALRGNEALLMDLIDDPCAVLAMNRALAPAFFAFYDHFHRILHGAGQPSVSWMGIPSPGKMHIPSCDFSFMISPGDFDRFALPGLREECAHMDHNIFHMDGPGVARHLPSILTLPKLNAIQWVQGAGEQSDIRLWFPLIRQIQQSNKGVVIDFPAELLEDVIANLAPEGLFLCVGTGSEEQEEAILARILRW